ncbi:MAG: hypothetical protein QM564_05170 [Bergeyella sp.]
MKKITVLFLIFSFGIMFSQSLIHGLTQMPPEKRKETINNMSPDERAKLLKELKCNMMAEELDIPQKEQEEFKALYAEYLEKQKQIKTQFQPSENYEQMTDEEAKQQLNQSFEVGQQLLNNRKEYSAKFMNVIKPQKVLHLYQSEGTMRNKMQEYKQEKPAPARKRR